jgi:hypothetical protein
MTNKILDFHSMVKQTGVWNSSQERFTLSAAESGFRAMKDVHIDEDKVGYYVDDGAGNWMYVVGTYSTLYNSPNYVVHCYTNNVVESSNSNSRISLTNGVSYNIHEGPSPLTNKFYGVSCLASSVVVNTSYTNVDFSTPTIDTNSTWSGTNKWFYIPSWCSQVEVDLLVKWADTTNGTHRGIYIQWSDDFESLPEWHPDRRTVSDVAASYGIQKVRSKIDRNVRFPSTAGSYTLVQIRLDHDYQSNTINASVYLVIRWIP